MNNDFECSKQFEEKGTFCKDMKRSEFKISTQKISSSHINKFHDLSLSHFQGTVLRRKAHNCIYATVSAIYTQTQIVKLVCAYITQYTKHGVYVYSI